MTSVFYVVLHTSTCWAFKFNYKIKKYKKSTKKKRILTKVIGSEFLEWNLRIKVQRISLENTDWHHLSPPPPLAGGGLLREFWLKAGLSWAVLLVLRCHRERLWASECARLGRFAGLWGRRLATFCYPHRLCVEADCSPSWLSLLLKGCSSVCSHGPQVAYTHPYSWIRKGET